MKQIEDFVHAIQEVGISISEDQANGNAIGGFYTPHNQNPETATRSSAREAYYDTVSTRTNLHLITGQQVTRILTDCAQDQVRVTGVEVRRILQRPGTFADQLAQVCIQHQCIEDTCLSRERGDFSRWSNLYTPDLASLRHRRRSISLHHQCQYRS